MIDLYLQTGIALILVSGLIVLLGLFTKKRQDKANLMNIMGYQSLGPKKGLAMVRVGEEVILVGVTATDVKLLKSMDRFADDRVRGKSWEKALAAETEVDLSPFWPCVSCRHH
jgi:flagellar biogenesis protein FliO